MPPPPAPDAPFDQVHRLVRSVPAGRVVTYGQVSAALGGRLSAAAVGWALRGCPDDVPWQRVVNARGRCSVGDRQQALLEREGVAFRDGAIDLAAHRHPLSDEAD